MQRTKATNELLSYAKNESLAPVIKPRQHNSAPIGLAVLAPARPDLGVVLSGHGIVVVGANLPDLLSVERAETEDPSIEGARAANGDGADVTDGLV